MGCHFKIWSKSIHSPWRFYTCRTLGQSTIVLDRFIHQSFSTTTDTLETRVCCDAVTEWELLWHDCTECSLNRLCRRKSSDCLRRVNGHWCVMILTPHGDRFIPDNINRYVDQSTGWLTEKSASILDGGKNTYATIQYNVFFTPQNPNRPWSPTSLLFL